MGPPLLHASGSERRRKTPFVIFMRTAGMRHLPASSSISLHSILRSSLGRTNTNGAKVRAASLMEHPCFSSSRASC